MNSKDGLWIWFLISRVVVYALLGALACGLVGAALLGVSGALLGGMGAATRWTFENMRPIRHSLAGTGAALGGIAGGVSGAFVGLIGLAILALVYPARRSFWPPKTVFTSLFLGMLLATVGVMTSYFVLCGLFSSSQGSFSNAVSAGGYWVLVAAPAVMVCGQIMAAMIMIRQQKAAR